MSNSQLSKFMVFYNIPSAVMAEWAKTEPIARKAAEEKMKAEWDQWIADHSKMILLTAAGGKTKKITAQGISETKNDICLYSLIEAESHEAAAKVFENHPHLQIPQAYIDVMAVRAM